MHAPDQAAERVTIDFARTPGNSYRLVRFSLGAAGTDGLETRSRTTGPRGTDCDGTFASEASAQLLALAFVRVAQYRFVRIALAKGAEVTLFADTSGSQVFGKFRHLYDGVRRSGASEHGSAWLRGMFALDPADDGREARGRAERWFTVTRSKPYGLVLGNLAELPPDAITITLDGKTVGEDMIDRIEAYLSSVLGAGLPHLFVQEGLTVGGRPPSVSAEWNEQEEESACAEELYEAGTARVLSVTGRSWTGKTMFAMHWLRRMLGTKRIGQRYLFFWSFSRQAESSYIPVPSLDFFTALAALLDITLPAKSSPAEQASMMLSALQEKPTFFLLDGIEASFAQGAGKNEGRLSGERDVGLARLLAGITRLNGSFVLATSRTAFDEVFGLSGSVIATLELQPTKALGLSEVLASYDVELAPEDRPVAIADLCQMLRRSAPAEGTPDFKGWLARAERGANLPSGYSAPKAPQSLSKRESALLNLVLSEHQGTPSLLALYVLAVAPDGLSGTALKAVAAKVSAEHPSICGGRLAEEDWEQALVRLTTIRMAQVSAFGSHYSLHPERALFITQGLRRNASTLWVDINLALGRWFLDGRTEPITCREEVRPLVEAAVYFCQAGEKQFAFDEIGRRLLSRGLKGYVITHLGDYEALKSINAAILQRDSEVADVSPVSPDSVTMCIHVYALCSRFLNELPQALEQERDAWARALASGRSDLMLPVGVNLLRLHHMFGNLREAAPVERTLLGKLGVDQARAWLGWKTLDLAPEDIVDGASITSATLALSNYFRNASTLLPEWILKAGIKACRNHGEDVEFLLPTFGRYWHGLLLLEMGRWKVCEQAFLAGSWFSERVRDQQTGRFESLAARLFLAKARAIGGADTLATAMQWAKQALVKAEAGDYRWWEAQARIVEAHILAEDRQAASAAQSIDAALSISRHQGFRMLEVDALHGHAAFLSKQRKPRQAAAVATEALGLANRIGYGLRKKPLEKLIASAT